MIACAAIFGPGIDRSASAQAPRYRIVVIEPPAGVSTIESINANYMGINNRGEATGTLLVNGSNLPFVWLPNANPNYSVLSAAGTHALPLDPERTEHLAREINVDGFVVGRAFLSEIGTSAYLWNLQAGTEGVIHLFTFEHKDEATDINDEDPAVIVGGAFVPPDSLTHGFRKILYTAGPQSLNFLLPSHIGSKANAISDSGFVAGTSVGPPPFPECGAVQDFSRAVTWPVDLQVPENLSSLGNAVAEALTEPVDVNNASPPMIVGVGDDPNDIVLPCRDRALFWADEFSQPIALPYLTVNGQPAADDMRAEAIADPFPDGRLQVVGRSAGLNVTVLWQRVNGVWTALKLKDLVTCGGEQWTNLRHAFDINDCGWIIGYGTLTNGSHRAFVLIPFNGCYGDIVGEAQLPNGKVDIDDLLTLINNWGTSNCILDITGDGTINIDDLLVVINYWGPCACWPVQESVQSFSQTLANAGLTMSDWNDFVSVMANGSPSEKENYNCWMDRHLTGCTRCPSCPAKDPFED